LKNNKLTKEQIKDTGIIFGIIMLFIGIYSASELWLKLSFVTILSAVIIPQIFTYPARLWFLFSEKLGSFVSLIMVSIIYFIVVIPIALVRKLMKKDPMQIRSFKKGRGTAWVNREYQFTPADMNKPF
jgi:hypothetical protein